MMRSAGLAAPAVGAPPWIKRMSYYWEFSKEKRLMVVRYNSAFDDTIMITSYWQTREIVCMSISRKRRWWISRA